MNAMCLERCARRRVTVVTGVCVCVCVCDALFEVCAASCVPCRDRERDVPLWLPVALPVAFPRPVGVYLYVSESRERV